MKNFIRSLSVLLAFLSPIVLAARASATVAWTATFEKNKSGDVCSSAAAGSEFTPGINETKGTRINAEVVAMAAHSGSLGCQVTVHPDDTFTYGQNRVDIQHQSTLTDEGKDSYLSGYYMMPQDAMVRNEIGFYETNKTSSNAMDIWVAPKMGGGTTINFAIGFLPDTPSWTADFKTSVWHQVGIHVHWSTNKTMGYADIWFDGVKTVSMLKGQTKPDGNTLFYQTGLHRRNTYQVTDTIYFDDFYEGDTEADMHIAVPTAGGSDAGVPPSDGGAAGVGGAVGSGGTAGVGGATDSGAGGTAGAGGSSSSSVAGNSGAAGSSTSGAGGSDTTGAAGSNSAGTAGTSGTVVARQSTSGCAIAGTNRPSDLAFAAFSLVALGLARPRNRGSKGRTYRVR